MMEQDPLVALREMRKDIPSLVEWMGSQETTVTKYPMISLDGSPKEAIGKCLLWNERIAVMDLFMPKNGKFPIHNHGDEIEVALFYEGAYELTQNGQTKVYRPMDVLICHPGQSHWGIVYEDTRVIFATVPGSEAYPHG